MKTETAVWYSYYASALINGDVSGLTEDEVLAVEAFERAVGGRIVACGEDTWFGRPDSWLPDVCGTLAGDVCEYTILID